MTEQNVSPEDVKAFREWKKNSPKTKVDVNYREGDWPHECSSCVNYNPPSLVRVPGGRGLRRGVLYPKDTPGTCQVVSGSISYKDFCDQFSPNRKGVNN